MYKKFKIFDSDALNNLHKRIFFSIAVFIISFSFIYLKIFNVMILSNFFSVNDSTIIIKKDKVDRGKIFDRNGILLASTVNSHSLVIYPKKIKNINLLSTKLSYILNIPEKNVKEKLLSKKNRIYIKRNITPREHQEIINLGETALKTDLETKRVYPMKEITSHVVGYTNIDGKGQSGIEKGLQSKLELGEDLNISIDIRIQNAARNELIKTIKKYSAQSGSVIILKINTGEILSLVNFPDFDPNNLNTLLTQYGFNSATQGLFEMGSTFKPITMAIGLDKKIIDEKILIDVSDPIRIGGHTINDYKPFKGKLDIKGIITKSSNRGAAKIAKMIGKKNQKDFFNKIGFFDQIDLEINETKKPLMPKYWGITETMTIGYGYGFAITPLHLCQAYSTIVNNGLKINPTLLLKNKDIYTSEKVISLTTSTKIKKLLRAVILETKYTGPRVKIPGYEIAGKTGTAEMIYGTGKNRSSFISVFPISNPKFVVLSMINDPKKIKESNYNNTGGVVAAPLTKEIILNIIKILNLPPSSKVDFLKASIENIESNKINVTL